MKFHARNRYIFLITLLFLLVSAFFWQRFESQEYRLVPKKNSDYLDFESILLASSRLTVIIESPGIEHPIAYSEAAFRKTRCKSTSTEREYVERGLAILQKARIKASSEGKPFFEIKEELIFFTKDGYENVFTFGENMEQSEWIKGALNGKPILADGKIVSQIVNLARSMSHFNSCTFSD